MDFSFHNIDKTNVDDYEFLNSKPRTSLWTEEVDA